MRSIVVAHYNEDLSWLRDIPDLAGCVIYVYVKGEMPTCELPENARLIRLPNVGRESHTYLYHVLTHYDKLSEYVLFIQGHPWDHRTKEQVFGPYMTCENAFYPVANKLRMPKWWKISQGGVKSSGGTISDWWRRVFDQPYPSYGTRVVWNGIFSVRRDLILKRPLIYYERLFKTLNHHSNPEEGHFFERTWGDIFAP